MESTASRTYPIQSSAYWCAGHTGDGRQVLLGLLCPNLVAYFFNELGNLIDIQHQYLAFLDASRPPDRPYDTYDPRIKPRQDSWEQA